MNKNKLVHVLRRSNLFTGLKPESVLNRLGVYFFFLLLAAQKFIYIMTTCVVSVSFDGIDSCVKSICDVVLKRFDYVNSLY